MGFQTASGVVLNRRIAGEGDLLLTLFLKGAGITFASARGAASGKVRFGGGTEPLTWGTFALYKTSGGGRHLKSVDIADDMLNLRTRSSALFAAVRWARLLMRHLMTDHPADDLLANLYWNMKLLNEAALPVEAAEWRFLWRWLKSWGLAPGLSDFMECSEPELELLHGVATTKSSVLREWTAKGILTPHAQLFATALRRAEGYLREI